MDPTCSIKSNSAELRKRAEESIRDTPFSQLTFLLPDRWPNPTGAQYYAYVTSPLPTGIVAYTVRGPTHRITFADFDGEPLVDVLEARELGQEDRMSASVSKVTRQTRNEAEQKLLELFTGCSTTEGAKAGFEIYRAWLASRPRITEDLRKREPAIIQWLEEERPRE